MTGPEHYREAEAHLATAAQNFLAGDDASSALAAAQVHATLALAAATAVNTAVNAFRDDINSNDVEEWAAAMYPQEAPRG